MKITPSNPKTTITMKTTQRALSANVNKWWEAGNDEELKGMLLGNAAFLKENQQLKYKQAAIYARLYGNMSLFNFIGSNMSKMDSPDRLPTDRPTFNLIQSAIDTLISRISQAKPTPVFLTDNGDYKERNLAKKLNNFILGEFYRTKAYEKGNIILRDALVEGTGCVKVFEENNKVQLERVFLTELLTDPNEGIYGDPRQLYQLKLMDRDVMQKFFKASNKKTEEAAQAYADNSSDSSKTVSDLVMVVEGWHLPSGPGAKDGRHTIACSSGILVDEPWEKPKFPFVFFHYSNRLLGFWSQGVAEQLMGTQLEINSLLWTISKAIKLIGVPRVFVEEGSKVVSAHMNNDIGTIVKYRGTKPIYEVAPCVPQEMYAQLQRMIDYGYQQCGVSQLQASAQKPAGLNSGEAIRSYEDISSDRFALLSKKHDNFYVDLAYAVIDLAKEIAERDGEYTTVYPNKNGAKEVDLPEASLLKDDYVIQCFTMSSLPRDPAGRMAKVTEMIQAGMVTIKEGRRLLDFPDVDQMDKLANASEERIFQILDEIIEEGKYTPPDIFMDLDLANDTSVQYYNLYSACKLEPEKIDMLINFFNQVQALKQAAMPPAPPPGMAPPQGPAGPNIPPQATPQPLPQSPMLPNANLPMGGA